jgi:MFS family permease
MSAKPADNINPFEPLRGSSFRWFYFAQLFSVCGTWMQSAAFHWTMWQLTASSLYVALLNLGCYSAMLVGLSCFASAADRFDRRTILLLTQSLLMVLAWVLALLAATGLLRPWQLFTAVILQGFVYVLDMPTRHAFLADIVQLDVLPKAIALNSVQFNTARVIGPSIAGVILLWPHTGAAWCFVLNGLSFIPVLFALVSIRADRGPHSSMRTAPAGRFEGLRLALSLPLVRNALILSTLIGTFGWSVTIMLPAFADHVLGGQSLSYGLMVAAIGAGAVGGSLVVSRMSHIHHLRERVYRSIFIWGLALLGFSFLRVLSASVALLALAGFGMAVFLTSSNSIVQMAAENHTRGRIMAGWSAVFAVGELLAALDAGVCGSLLGPSGAIRLNAILMIATGIIAIVVTHKSRLPGEEPLNTTVGKFPSVPL